VTADSRPRSISHPRRSRSSVARSLPSILVTLLAACAGPGPATHAAQRGDPALRSEFEALYARQAELLTKRDVDALMELDTPDYSVVLLDGSKVDREHLAAGMRSYFTSGQLVRQVSLSYTIHDVTLRNDRAIVLVEQKDQRVQVRIDGKPHDVEANVIHSDTWVRSGSTCRRTLTEEVEQTKFTVDGTAPAQR
jgi:hypothetical protein